MIPFIPILAALGIIGGITALAWYGGLSSSERQEADRKAMAMFGQAFQDLSAAQQKRVQDSLNNKA